MPVLDAYCDGGSTLCQLPHESYSVADVVDAASLMAADLVSVAASVAAFINGPVNQVLGQV